MRKRKDCAGGGINRVVVHDRIYSLAVEMSVVVNVDQRPSLRKSRG